MSYVRFGEKGSDVYVYLDVDGTIHCCGCFLLPEDEHCPRTATAAGMADHLRRHLAAGHVVPSGVIECIEANPQLDPLLDRADRPAAVE